MMKRLMRVLGLLVTLMVWTGCMPVQPDASSIVFTNDDGVWLLDTEARAPRLWIANRDDAVYQALASRGDLVFIVDERSGSLYTAQLSENELSPLTKAEGGSISVDPVFELLVSEDGRSIFYAEAISQDWYRYELSSQSQELIYAEESFGGCGNNLLPLDESLLNAFRFSVAWREDELLIPINCRGGIQAVAGSSRRILLEDLRNAQLDATGNYLLGDFAGALGVFDVKTGELQVMHSDYIGNYQNWWWDEDAVLFSVAQASDRLDVAGFADETLAESFLGSWYPNVRSVWRYETSLYRWQWRESSEARLIWPGENVRGIESLVLHEDGIYFTAVDSAYALVEALQGQASDTVNGSMIALSFTELEALVPRSRIFFLANEEENQITRPLASGYGLLLTD